MHRVSVSVLRTSQPGEARRAPTSLKGCCEMSAQKKENGCLCGVKCDVESCAFNNQHHHCTANEIEVCTCSVRDEKDAACETYQIGRAHV